MINIGYIGGCQDFDTNKQWGGWIATNYAYLKAFEQDAQFQIDVLPRNHIEIQSPHKAVQQILDFVKAKDIIHLDETTLCELMYRHGMMTPDVIGPLTRSPVKQYKGWQCQYTQDWFYKAKVIRLNYQEERKHKEYVTLVRHGVDTNMLVPSYGRQRKYILWAGTPRRDAKNYPLWQKIRAMQCPKGYSFIELTNYPIRQYWDLLDETAIVICTSKYESFCCCAFEAMSKGVPVVWREGLQGGILEECGVRVPYTPEGFMDGICTTLDRLSALSEKARHDAVSKVSLGHMRDSYAAVFQSILDSRTPS